MTQGSFWALANYAKDMVIIDRIATFQDLNQWISMTVPLESIKARLVEIPGLDRERRTQIQGLDIDFDGMCTRLARCAIPGKAVQLNAIDVNPDPKNGDDLGERGVVRTTITITREAFAAARAARAARAAKAAKAAKGSARTTRRLDEAIRHARGTNVVATTISSASVLSEQRNNAC